MKKTIFFLITFLIGMSIFGQTRYHRLRKLGNDLTTATSNFCQSIALNQLKLNITNIPNKLSVGTTLSININDTYVDGYYKVEYSQNNSNQDADETVAYSAIALVNFDCSSLKPDLQALSVSPTNTSSVNAGSNKSINYSVKNVGAATATANSTQSMFYLSSDNNYSTNDVLIKTISIATINVNQTITGSTSLTIPSNTSYGSYYIIMKVNNGEDLNVNNNIISSISSFIINILPPDTDSDGVPDSSDNCPNEAGPASNNGCPTFADLIIDPSSSTAISSGAPGTTQYLSSNTFHALYLSENLQILLYVKNVGQANSNSMKVGFYVTQGSIFSNATLLKEVTYNGAINPNQSQSMSTQISGSSIAGYANSNGWAYIHIRVDKDNSVNEGTSGGEDNNIYSSIPVITYYTPR